MLPASSTIPRRFCRVDWAAALSFEPIEHGTNEAWRPTAADLWSGTDESFSKNGLTVWVPFIFLSVEPQVAFR